MIHNFENTEGWEEKAGNILKLGISKLSSSPILHFRIPFLCIHHQKIQSLPLSTFHTSPIEKTLGCWKPEFFHIHVFMRIHETKNKEPRRFKTLNVF